MAERQRLTKNFTCKIFLTSTLLFGQAHRHTSVCLKAAVQTLSPEFEPLHGPSNKKNDLILRSFLLKWRRGRDSNSGWGRPHDGFQDRCIKPLCHLSSVLRFLKDFLLKRIKKVKTFFYIFQKKFYIPIFLRKTNF